MDSPFIKGGQGDFKLKRQAQGLPLHYQDLRGHRLFAHISIVLNDFMFTKRANFGEMRKSCITPLWMLTTQKPRLLRCA